MCEDEKEIRKLASQVLPESDVYGDPFGVPSLIDIVEKLVEKVKEK